MATKYQKTIRVSDKHDFHYEVEILFYPHFGFANAIYKGRVISQRDSYKLHPPYSDDEGEQEDFDEKLIEWMQEVEVDLRASCGQYFNNNN